MQDSLGKTYDADLSANLKGPDDPKFLCSSFSMYVPSLLDMRFKDRKEFDEIVREDADEFSFEFINKIEHKNETIQITFPKYNKGACSSGKVCYTFASLGGFTYGKLLQIVANILDPDDDYENEFFVGLKLEKDSTFSVVIES